VRRLDQNDANANGNGRAAAKTIAARRRLRLLENLKDRRPAEWNMRRNGRWLPKHRHTRNGPFRAVMKRKMPY
jgi:hypothetical protein